MLFPRRSAAAPSRIFLFVLFPALLQLTSYSERLALRERKIIVGDAPDDQNRQRFFPLRSLFQNGREVGDKIRRPEKEEEGVVGKVCRLFVLFTRLACLLCLGTSLAMAV